MVTGWGLTGSSSHGAITVEFESSPVVGTFGGMFCAFGERYFQVSEGSRLISVDIVAYCPLASGHRRCSRERARRCAHGKRCYCLIWEWTIQRDSLRLPVSSTVSTATTTTLSLPSQSVTSMPFGKALERPQHFAHLFTAEGRPLAPACGAEHHDARLGWKVAAGTLP